MKLARLGFVLLVAGICFAESGTITVRGKLTHRKGKPPAIETVDHKFISLDGDAPTRGVLKDKRLAGMDLEVTGHFTGPDELQVDPIHTKALHVLKDGKRLLISYWCDTCSIRTYTPGQCWCCQQETALDLRESDKE